MNLLGVPDCVWPLFFFNGLRLAEDLPLTARTYVLHSIRVRYAPFSPSTPPSADVLVTSPTEVSPSLRFQIKGRPELSTQRGDFFFFPCRALLTMSTSVLHPS